MKAYQDSYAQAKKLVKEYEEKIEQTKLDDLFEKNRKLVGKKFKFLNSYGSDHEKWWLWTEIIGVAKDNITTISYQDSNLRVEVQRMDHLVSSWQEPGLGEGYLEATESEFTKGRDQVLKKLHLQTR